MVIWYIFKEHELIFLNIILNIKKDNLFYTLNFSNFLDNWKLEIFSYLQSYAYTFYHYKHLIQRKKSEEATCIFFYKISTTRLSQITQKFDGTSFPQKSNIQQLKEEIREKLPETTTEGNGGTSITGTNSTGTSTLRHRKNRPAPQPPQRPSSHNGAISAPEQLEIRAPSELLLGVPSTLKTQWRHQPKALVTGCVTYVANVSLIASVLSSLLSLFLLLILYFTCLLPCLPWTELFLPDSQIFLVL